jgi:hypothetical protein
LGWGFGFGLGWCFRVGVVVVGVVVVGDVVVGVVVVVVVDVCGAAAKVTVVGFEETDA